MHLAASVGEIQSCSAQTRHPLLSSPHHSSCGFDPPAREHEVRLRYSLGGNFTCIRQSRRFPWPWLLPSSSSASCLLGLSLPLANSLFTASCGASSPSSSPGERAEPGPELAGDPPPGEPSRAFFIGGWLPFPPIESFFFGTVCRLPSLEAWWIVGVETKL